jgi:MOSC domain-containing protein YiiM
MERSAIDSSSPVAAGAAGRVEAIWIKRLHRRPTEPVERAEVIAGHGLAGNVRQGRRRQVTFIAREAWHVMMEELGADVDPGARRANVMLSGIDLRDCRGGMLEINGVRFELAGETRPCERMDEALPGLRRTMGEAWRGGAFALALDDGTIRVGDRVELVLADAADAVRQQRP